MRTNQPTGGDVIVLLAALAVALLTLWASL